MEFGSHCKKPDGLQSICKVCRKEYAHKWYLENSDLQKSRARKSDKKRVMHVRENIISYLKLHPCVDCGENDPVVLEFDHLRDKEFNIGEALTLRLSWSRVEKELLKCEVRCANCHRRKTARERGWYRYCE